MKATAEQVKLANKIAKDNKVQKVYLNSKGEFFTSKNSAENSDDKDNVVEIDCGVETPKAEGDKKTKS